MQTKITFKKIDSSDALKSYIIKKIDKFDRLLESPAEAHVVLRVEKIRHIAELTLTCDKINIHIKEESDNMYSSIDALMDTVKIQINKQKEKSKRHMSGKKESLKNSTEEFDHLQKITENNFVNDQIILETIDDKPMGLDDAIIELNSSQKSFFVFNNARSEQLNVLYKHEDGKLRLIQPKG